MYDIILLLLRNNFINNVGRFKAIVFRVILLFRQVDAVTLQLMILKVFVWTAFLVTAASNVLHPNVKIVL